MSPVPTASARRLTLVPAAPRPGAGEPVRRYRLARVLIEGPEAGRGRVERPQGSSVRRA